jgi:hypothetical protein
MERLVLLAAQAEAEADPIRQTFDELIGKLYPEKKINGLD